MPDRKIIITGDGSHTIFVPELDETYHSAHGAVQESRHVFIEAGLDFYVKNSSAKTVRIFEVGFGTGLNALLTALYARNHIISIRYAGIEAYPLQRDEWSALNYPGAVAAPGAYELFQKIHEAPWDENYEISSFFMLKKINGMIAEYEAGEKYDICYFDAFAPSKQPEMWDMKILEKIHGLLAPGGVFVTYSARGQLKRDLRSLGMEVAALPGPPGKKEMVRAVKV